MKLEDKYKWYIIKRLLNVYCEIFGTRSYGGDALASSCVLRHMNSCRIFHNIHSITYNCCSKFAEMAVQNLSTNLLGCTGRYFCHLSNASGARHKMQKCSVDILLPRTEVFPFERISSELFLVLKTTV